MVSCLGGDVLCGGCLLCLMSCVCSMQGVEMSYDNGGSRWRARAAAGGAVVCLRGGHGARARHAPPIASRRSNWTYSSPLSFSSLAIASPAVPAPITQQEVTSLLPPIIH